MKQVSVVGLGDMGIGMAKNLVQSGFSVTGFDLRTERVTLLEQLGGKGCDGLAEVAQADVVFVMVLNGKQVYDVVTTDGGLMHTMKPGSTLIVSATIEPREIREVEAAIAGKGIHLIDSPVSGGKPGAEAGTLTMMVATPQAVFETNQDVLRAVGEKIFHVGEAIGAGQTVKASLQALIGVTFVGIFESLVLGAKAGVKGETLYEVFSNTHVGDTPFFKNCAQHILDREFKDTGSHIGTMYKDLGITMALAKESGVALFATSTAHQLFQSGISLFPDEDNWSIVKFLEMIAETEVTW